MSQQHGLPSFPGQQGFNDLQLRRQRLIQNQLQLQRQRQLNRLDKDEKLQGTVNLPSVVEKGASSNQVTTFLNGRPTNDVFNYKSSNAMMSSEHMTADNPEMLTAGFMNWPEGRRSPLFPASNGLMIFSNDESTTTQSIGLVSQLADQSLFGKPISSIEGSLNQCSSFQGMSPDYPDMQMKSGGNQIGVTGRQHAQLDSFLNEQSTPEQGCLSDGNAIFFTGPVSQNLFANDKNGLGSALALGSLQQNLSCQELHRHEHASWFSNALQMAARSAGPSHDVTCIDPTEEKILFGTDDYTWGSPGRSMNMIADGPCPGDTVESNDCFGAFPTIHSGSWSALMQEAVQASSSIDRLQEEWSGLSFQNIEPPTQNHSGVSNDIGMQQNISGLQQPSKAPNNYDDRVPAEVSCESFTQSSTISQSEQFSQAQGQKQLLQGSAQEGHIHESWAGHLHTVGSQMFPCNQVGSLRMNKESAISTSHSYSQGMFPDCPDFNSQVQNAEKNPSTNNENMTGTEEISCIDTISCHESAASTTFDGPTTYIYHNRKVDLTRNSGLRLIPSSQRLPSFSSHAKQIDRSSMDREWTQLDSAVSDLPPIPALGGPERESLENKSSLPVQTGLLQQLPEAGSDSILHSNSLSVYHQLGSSMLLHNAWSSASPHQHLSGAQLQRVIPLIPPLDLVSCSVSAQQADYGEVNRIEESSQGKLASERTDIHKTGCASNDSELIPGNITDRKPALSNSTLVLSHQHNISRDGQDSSLGSQAEHVTTPNISPSGISMLFHAQSMEPSDIDLSTCSLLQQVQAMKGADFDTSKRVEKMLRGAEFVSGASSVNWKADQKHSEQTLNVSFSTDGKMPSFISIDNDEMGTGMVFHLVSREGPSQVIQSSGQHDLHNQTECLSSMPNIIQRSRLPQGQIGYQTASSLFERQGIYKNSQVLSVLDGHGSDKAVDQQISITKPFQCMDSGTLREQMIESRQFGSLERCISSSGRPDYELSAHPPFGIKDHNMKIRLRKRKRPPSKLLPWHMEVAASSRRLQSIRMTEQDWILVANRLIEKMDDEADMIEDSISAHHSRRRLVLTTQLMQQILPPLPYDVLSQGATGSYRNVTYLLTKSVLGDACGLLSCSSVSEKHSNHEMVISNKNLTSGKPRDDLFLKVVECFLGRLGTLENDFSRLLNRVLMLDIKVECQELDNFSIINRLVKFHGRVHTVVEGSSFSEAFSHKIYPQRDVMAIPMPRDLPEGMLCLSL